VHETDARLINKREKRETREQTIIAKAIGLLTETGFLDMRMADVASATSYSMGTIYSHFESKEDLIVACAYTLCLDEKWLFDEIHAQQIPDIEKIISLAQCSWIISMEHPALIEIDNLSLMPSVWRRATLHRAERLNQLHVELTNTLVNMVLNTIENGFHGHSKLDQAGKEQLATHLTHGLWGLCVGLSSTAQSGYTRSLCPQNSSDTYKHFTANYTYFLKGYGWQETNPDAVFDRSLSIARQCINQTTWYPLSSQEAIV